MRIQKLKENREFRRAYNRGKVFVTPFAVIYVTKNRTGDVRLGITAGKKVGKAVKRNRCRRIIREAFRGLLPEVKRGYDYVFVARAATVNKKSTDMAHIMRAQLKSIGHLQ